MTPIQKAWEQVRVAFEEGSAEELLCALADLFDVDRASESDPSAAACLQSAAEHCRQAAMDYDASTK